MDQRKLAKSLPTIQRMEESEGVIRGDSLMKLVGAA
jgi:hypothetical protein